MHRTINIHVDASEKFEVKVNRHDTIVVQIGKLADDLTVFMRRDTAKDLVLQLTKILLEGEDNDISL